MHDLIIIGAGPAGLTAALYAGRFRLDTLALERMNVGGQIVLSATIENYPGFPGGITTHELIEKFKGQVDEVGVRIGFEDVIEVTQSFRLQVPIYHVKTSENSYEAKSLIIATGAQPKRLGVEGEVQLTGRGVSYCGTCDGPFFRDKDILVVGGGDRAVEEAIFLTGYARSVSLVHRRQELRASGILVDKAKDNPKIKFFLDSVIEKIHGKDKVEEVVVKNVKTGVVNGISCQGVFIFVGIIPNAAFLKNLLRLDEAGFIITDQDMRTSSNGVFACGDCRKKVLYQVVTACGDGATAADSVHKYIINQGKI